MAHQAEEEAAILPALATALPAVCVGSHCPLPRFSFLRSASWIQRFAPASLIQWLSAGHAHGLWWALRLAFCALLRTARCCAIGLVLPACARRRCVLQGACAMGS